MEMNPSQIRIFNALYGLAVISLLAFAVLFFILCSDEDLTKKTTNEVKDRNVSTDPVLGQFGSTGAAIIIIGMPLLFILLAFLYCYHIRSH